MSENPMNKFTKKKKTNKSSPTHKSTNNKPKLNEAFFLQRDLRLSCPKFLSRLGWKYTGWKPFSVSFSIENEDSTSASSPIPLNFFFFFFWLYNLSHGTEESMIPKF